MKYIITTIAFIIFTILVINHTNKVDQARNNYWETQQELCHQVGWYSETGLREDCQPTTYLINK